MSKESEAKNREARLLQKKIERDATLRADARQIWMLFSAGKLQLELRELMIGRTLGGYSTRMQVELLLQSLVYAAGDVTLARQSAEKKEGSK